MRLYVWKISVFVLVLGCRKDVTLNDHSKLFYHLPSGFPQVDYPEDNTPNINRIALGKLLFFDPILSADSSIACASCHKPEFLFSDTSALSIGVNAQFTKRNSPSLINIAYQPNFNRDGGVRSIELQALVPLQASHEMNSTIEEVEYKLRRQERYQLWFQKAFETEPNIYGITRALAAYQRTLIAGNSRFDEYFYEGNTAALTNDEKLGMNMFFSSKAKCASCHNGFNFTNFAFENNGLYANYNDEGRYLVTLNIKDIGKFRVPTLRGISKTAPYMHDGSLKTLEDVLEHYASGGQSHPNQNEQIKQISLTEQEQKQIIAFLLTLEARF